jgi:hypothetical protein
MDRWVVWARQDTLLRAVVISVVVVALMALATAVIGVHAQALNVTDITVDPASGFLPF